MVLDALLYLGGIFVVLLGIALSIGLHEVGHLVPAKVFGVKVKQYMVGFGPTVISRQKGDTEYGIKAIPLGGYILMEGMYPPEKKPYSGPFSKWIADARADVRKDIGQEDEDRQFYKLSAPKKLTIMLGGPVMNLLLGVLLIVTSLSGIGTLQNSMTINQVFPCVEPVSGSTCPDGIPQSPAALAGIQAGDKVVAIGDTQVSTWNEAIAELSKNPGGASDVTVERSSGKVTLSISPVFMERQLFDSNGQAQVDENGFPITELRPIIGVQLKPSLAPQPVVESFGYAMAATAGVMGFILQLPEQVFQIALSTFGLAERDPNGAISILGVGQLAGEVSSSDVPVEARLATLLLLIGSLNLALFAFNLIPLLPLDGGHVLGALYEGAKRKSAKLIGREDPGPIDTAKALPIAYAMWGVLLFTGILLIFADIVNPISLI